MSAIVAVSSCHGQTLVVDDSERALNKECVGCHGSLTEVAAKNTAHIIPHKSHLGDINCTACHSGHAPSQPYCFKCHNFGINIPGGGQKPADVPKSASLPSDETMKSLKRDTTDVLEDVLGTPLEPAYFPRFDTLCFIINRVIHAGRQTHAGCNG